MTRKTEEWYTRLFRSLNDFTANNELDLNSRFISTDFEQAAINASKCEYPDTNCIDCLFHLGQSLWSQI